MIPGPGELGLLDNLTEKESNALLRTLSMMMAACMFAMFLMHVVERRPEWIAWLLDREVLAMLVGVNILGFLCLARIASKGIFGAWELGLSLGLLYGVCDNAKTVSVTQSSLSFLVACFLGADGFGAVYDSLGSSGNAQKEAPEQSNALETPDA